MKTYICGYTNAGNIAVMPADWSKGADVDCNGALIKYVLVIKTGEWVKYANFPNQVPTVPICAENAHAAASAFAGQKFDAGLGEAKGWEIQRTNNKARNRVLCDAFVERFTREAQALTIGQLKVGLTAKQFAAILRHARDGYSCNQIGGDPFFKDALVAKLKQAVGQKQQRQTEWGRRMARLKPRFGYVLPQEKAKIGQHTDNGPMCYFRRELAWQKRQLAIKKAATLAKRREPLRQLALHIGRFYRPEGLMNQGQPVYGGSVASESRRGRRGWHTVQHAAAGIAWQKTGLFFYPKRNAATRKVGPRIPRELKKRIDLTAPHPIGLFAARLDDAPDYVACFDASADKKSWVIVGFAFKGHLVPESVVRGTVTLDEITAVGSDELKRIMVERYGTERYLKDIGAQPVQLDDWGTLYDMGSYRIVRMVNSTIEPDGTAREYFRAVPKTCETARSAIAWTYNLTDEEYQPAAMS